MFVHASLKNKAAFIALAFCLIVTIAQVMLKSQKEPVADALGYISIAQNLSETGVFSNPSKETTFEKGSFFAPMYPAFLSLFASIDEDTSNAFKCYKKYADSCDSSALKGVFLAQAMIAAVSVFCVYLIALQLFSRQDLAWLSMGVTIASKAFSHYAGLLLTENLAFMFFMLFLVFYIRAVRNFKNIASWSFAAMFLAFAVLARPTYVYFLYFTPAIAVVWGLWKQQYDIKKTITVFGLMNLVSMIVIIPWATRNYVVFGDFFITNGYASFILVQRLAYNMMSWAEWGVGFVFLLPDFGDSLAAYLFDENLYKRLTWYDPSSFYSIGNGSYRGETIELAGGLDNHFSYLIREVLLPDIGKHIMVTFVLLLRGMWVGKYIGLIAVIALPYIILLMKKKGQLLEFLLFMLPCFFFLGFHAFVSVNVTRYNEPLIAIYAIIISLVLLQLGAKIKPLKVKSIERG